MGEINKEKRVVIKEPFWKKKSLWIIGILIIIIIGLYMQESKHDIPEDISKEYYENVIWAFDELNMAFEEGKLPRDEVIELIAGYARSIERYPNDYTEKEIYINELLSSMSVDILFTIEFGEGNGFEIDILNTRDDLINVLELEENYMGSKNTDSNEEEVNSGNLSEPRPEESESPDIVDPDLNINEVEGIKDPEWSEYYNERFEFSIPYPSDWNIGEEPTNGDGITLYQDSENEILVYASYYMEDFAPDLSNYEKFANESGEEVYINSQENGEKILYDGVIISESIEFHLSGSLSKEFYNKNIDILNQMLINAKVE